MRNDHLEVHIKSGVSGFYCYAIYERPAGCHAFCLAHMRMIFTLRQEKFHYMAISDTHRIMSMPENLLPGRGKRLIVPESEVDDKCQYSVDNKDIGVHRWISSDPIFGFWIIFRGLSILGANRFKWKFYHQECYSWGLWTGVQVLFVINLIALVTISAGSETQPGNLTYVPLRDNPTVREIGFPDRTAIGYYIPDMNPAFVNKLFINSPEKFRQYGLRDRCTDMHPGSDQTFKVGINDPKKIVPLLM
ncbi:hypothetical protein GH714_000513 [Hevea brasiliensis]|uniref:Uncharacterized protein n=1 Tax=Hevea brasiliensis TaxID=3981 RepID=A0A6A6LWN7_HEVBR|nr:hypothetical protein GH714_000513 [Hevea brasiliensis]